MNNRQILSVAAGIVMLTACSEYDPGLVGAGAGDYTPSELQLMEKYTENFEARYGKIDDSHTWGFGGAEAGAKTRGAKPEGNLWVSEGWNIPPALTEEQKDVVRQYFQQNKDFEYTDPSWTNYWIQQVYKGGTNTAGSQTPEKYTMANDQEEFTGSDKMDYLMSRDANGVDDHINNSNNSDNQDWAGRMLMVNSSTHSFGYHSAMDNQNHYNSVLVSWTVIRDWANAKGLNGDCLNDGLNRSYMGFDFTNLMGDEIYDAEYDWNNGGVFIGYKTFEFEGQTYRYLKNALNTYAYDKNESVYGGKKEFQDRPSDDEIRQLLQLGYLPYEEQFKNWIKPGLIADGYYSDWIVTLTEGHPGTSEDPETPTGETWYRIMCEDLGNTNDFDFNDLVFDVYFTGEPWNYVAHVRVQAAGGTLPIYFQYAENDLYEAHKLLGSDAIVPINVGTGNTAAPKDVEIPMWIEKPDPNYIDIYVEKRAPENKAERNVILLPKSGGNSLTKAPQKICIPNGQNVRWMKEMQQIESAYRNFDLWVQDANYGFKWTTEDVNEGPLY